MPSLRSYPLEFLRPAALHADCDGCRAHRADRAPRPPGDSVLEAAPPDVLRRFYASPFNSRTQNAAAPLILDAGEPCTLVTDNMLGSLRDKGAR